MEFKKPIVWAILSAVIGIAFGFTTFQAIVVGLLGVICINMQTSE